MHAQITYHGDVADVALFHSDTAPGAYATLRSVNPARAAEFVGELAEAGWTVDYGNPMPTEAQEFVAGEDEGAFLAALAEGPGYDEDENRDHAEEAYNGWLMAGGDV